MTAFLHFLFPMHSRHLPLLLLALPVAAAPSNPDPDLLRFMNGDALHGRFEGLQDGATIEWSGSNLKTPVLLQTGKLRRLSLNGGRATKLFNSPSYILLPDGDQVPGEIVALDQDHITIDSPVAGTLTLPREHVRTVAPNPHGGTLHYLGPFSPEGWTVITRSNNQARVRRREEAKDPNAPDMGAAETADDKKKNEEEPWIFAGGAWYNNGQLPIKVDAKLPDKARIAFRLAWRNRLNAVIAFHATTEIPAPPEADEDDEEDGEKENAPHRVGSHSSSYPHTFGHSYVLTIYSSYAMLYRCDFDKDGNGEQTRLSTSSSNIRLDDSGEAEFELRCDRANNSIILFIDGHYVSQWEDAAGYVGTGSHLAFACQNNSSRLRVSDLVVSSWNGMIDSARSMDADDRDVILLTNGTDRFSGDLTGLEDGKFLLRGTYADMKIPVEQVEEIRFARKRVAPTPAPSGKALRLILQPVGRLTLDPVSATRSTLEARSAVLGDIELDLGYASLLEFSFSDSILDSWDDDF